MYEKGKVSDARSMGDQFELKAGFFILLFWDWIRCEGLLRFS